jgi:hypothetical protein
LESDWWLGVGEPSSFGNIRCCWSTTEFDIAGFVGDCLPYFESEFGWEKRKESKRVRGRRNIWLFGAKAVLIMVVHEVDDSSGTHFEKQEGYSRNHGGSGTESFIFYQNFNSNLVS